MRCNLTPRNIYIHVLWCITISINAQADIYPHTNTYTRTHTHLLHSFMCHLMWKSFHQKGKKQILHHYLKRDRGVRHYYRQVILTSDVLKLLETCIKDHLGECYVKCKIITGLPKVRSCPTNLLCCLEDITKWVDDGSP